MDARARRWLLRRWLLATFGAAAVADAQSVTTAAISGTVSEESGAGIEGAEVRVVHLASGFVTASRSGARGHFVVQGLEPGGPYTVTVRHLGFLPAVRDSVFLTLGQDLRLQVPLGRAVAVLPTLQVLERAVAPCCISPGALAIRIDDSALRRIPSSNRDLFDFVRLVPQVSMRQGISGAGVNHRLNAIQIDGVSEQALFGGTPAGGVFGGRAIPLDAVREYQVVLASYDVRHGDFAGALINAVTRSGTNQLDGAAFYQFRNERLARNEPFIRDARFEREQFGGYGGGPIIRNRAHLFVATEYQRFAAPATGPYLGGSGAALLPADPADLARFDRILRGYGLIPGSAAAVTNSNPAANLFARVDVLFPRARTRVMVRHNVSWADSSGFSRPFSSRLLPLSSIGTHQVARKQSMVTQLFTNFAAGAYNELFLGLSSVPIETRPDVRQPLVVVAVPRVDGQGPVFLSAGSSQGSQPTALGQRVFEMTENLTVPMGEHRFTFGGRLTAFRMRANQLRGTYGVWGFSSLDSLQRGEADSVRVVRDFGGGSTAIDGARYVLYAGDQWAMRRGFTITYGLRLDVRGLGGHPPYNRVVDSLFGRRTDAIPRRSVRWSPRIGFESSIDSENRVGIHGGIGLFTGQPPLAWLAGPFIRYGHGVGVLRCGAQPNQGLPPSFEPDYRAVPATCANGSGFVRNGPVEMLDRGFGDPQFLRGSLGARARLPRGLIVFLDGLRTQGVHEGLFVNRALAGPISADRHGRVLYGRIDPLGFASPALVDTKYPEVIDLTSQAQSHSINVTGRLEQQVSRSLWGTVAYSFTRARDVQSASARSLVAFDNWRGRAISGRHDALRTGISDYEQAHRVVGAAAYALPWASWRTTVSVNYVGESGLPFTFVAAAGVPGKGDLNADGTNENDPVYVPVNTSDTTEIRLSGTPAEIAEQRVALEQRIRTTSCLARQRGRILARNSCRGPWANTLHLQFSQSLRKRDDAVRVEMQIFNLLNLLDRDWGLVGTPNVNLLSHVAQVTLPDGITEPVFRYDTASRRRLDSNNIGSAFQIQVGVRIGF